MEHRVEWTAASPTWPLLTNGTDPAAARAFNRPSILRFATDSFMDDFVAMLDVDPMRLGEFAARPETWRGPAASVTPTPPVPPFARALQRRRLNEMRRTSSPRAVAIASLANAQAPVLKLYQPAHQRYYLVAASLVCQLPGLPDRAIDPAQDERATFVIRRLLPKPGIAHPTADPATADELAFVIDASGHGWRPVTSAGALVPGEEQLPLSPITYRGDDGRKRRVLSGLVPVSRREAYLGASPRDQQSASTPAAAAPTDSRMTLLQQQITEPWRQLSDRAATIESILRKARDEDPNPSRSEREQTRKDAREQIQTVSWYVLLDLAKFLESQLSNVWAALNGAAVALSTAETALVAAIDATMFTKDSSTRSLRSALIAIRAREAQLERVTTPYTEGSRAWPPELFPLATIRSTEELSPRIGDLAPPPIERVSGLTPSGLESLVRAALPASASAGAPTPPIATRPLLAPSDPGWFVIRCVYERPHCGPFAPPAVSEATDVFQLAGFFDPDAPARPIRIGLPVDVSPAGLRKFDKNTAFMVSDMLCGHIQRMKGVTLGDLVRSVLPWPLHKDLPVSAGGPCSDAAGCVGMMLSISIPIVTIAALLLVMIIVNLLDTILRWMPYFMVAFPVPGFCSKENS
jgi:hypothetical protein